MNVDGSVGRSTFRSRVIGALVALVVSASAFVVSTTITASPADAYECSKWHTKADGYTTLEDVRVVIQHMTKCSNDVDYIRAVVCNRRSARKVGKMRVILQDRIGEDIYNNAQDLPRVGTCFKSGARRSGRLGHGGAFWAKVKVHYDNGTYTWAEAPWPQP